MTHRAIITILILCVVGQAYACKCGGLGTVKESFKSTELIVYGKVIHIDTIMLSETIKDGKVKAVREAIKRDEFRLNVFEKTYVLKVELEVIEKFKGEKEPKSIIIYTPLLSATCGYKFKKDEQYIVYASRRNFLSDIFQLRDKDTEIEKDDTFWASHCSRTTEFSSLEAEELRSLK